MKKKYKQRLRLVLKLKLIEKNIITAINAWEMAVFRYSAGILQRIESELKDFGRKSSKTMTIHGGFHSKSHADRLYIKRKERGTGLISVKHCVREEENSSGFYAANLKKTQSRK